MIDPLSAGITAAGGLISSIFGMKSQDDTNKANMELAKYQYEKALEMWNKQNEYNTPSAQRQRMEAAGFNPNLVYGHGSVANTASSAPEYHAPTLQAYTNFPNIGSDVANILLASRKNQAEVRKLEAEAAGAEQDARGKKIDADVKEKYGLDNGMIDNRNKWYENDLLGYRKQWEEEKSKYREEWVDALFRKDFREVERLEKEMALCDANIEKASAAAENYRADTSLKVSQKKYIDGPQTAQAYSAARLNNSNARKADEDAKYRSFENKWHFLNQSFEWRNLNARTRNLLSDLSSKVLNRQISIQDASIRARKILVDEERLSMDQTKLIWGMVNDALEIGVGVATLIP